MRTLYAACLARLGLSPAEAGVLYGVDIGAVEQCVAEDSHVQTRIWDDLRRAERHIAQSRRLFCELWAAAGGHHVGLDASVVNKSSFLEQKDPAA